MSEKLIEQLTTFVTHVSTLEELDQFDVDGFSKEYNELRKLFLRHRDENKFPAEEGKKDFNLKKNRYKDILPYDATRVKLSAKDGVPGSDYINANFIKGANDKVAYIAAQGPLPNTVRDFWRMLWEFKIQVIIMVCQEKENGKAKCEPYLGKRNGEFHIEITKEEKVSEFFVMRTLSVWKDGEEANKRQMTHLHYSGWFDHDIPHDLSDIINLIALMREKQLDEDIPPVIHCSAGCGRTGTICAIDYAWNVLKGGKMSDDFSLFNIIRDMRSQRPSLVQTAEQYKIVHLAVKKMFEDQLRLIDNHNYENISLNEERKSIGSSTGATSKLKQGAKLKSAMKDNSEAKPSIQKTSNIKSDSSAKPLKPVKPECIKKPPLPLNKPKSVSDESSSPDSPEVVKKPDDLDSSKYENTCINTGKFVTKVTVGNPPNRLKSAATKTFENLDSQGKPFQSGSAPNKAVAKTAKVIQQDMGLTNKETISSHDISTEKNKTRPPAYANQELSAEQDKSNPPAFSNPDISAEKIKSRPPAYSNQEISTEKNKSRAPAYSNQDISTEKVKKRPPPYSNQEFASERNKSWPQEPTSKNVSHETLSADKNKNRPPACGIQDKHDVDQPSKEALHGADEEEYGVIWKHTSAPKAVTSVSKRNPAPLPPNGKPSQTPAYEKVDSMPGTKDYSYAEPNSTTKWALQDLARVFDQKNRQMPKTEPVLHNHLEYEAVNVCAMPDDSPPQVPKKTEGAYILNAPETADHKKKMGIIETLKNKIPGGNKFEPDVHKVLSKENDARFSGTILGKKILEYPQRGQRPKGPRPAPASWSYESSTKL